LLSHSAGGRPQSEHSCRDVWAHNVGGGGSASAASLRIRTDDVSSRETTRVRLRYSERQCPPASFLSGAAGTIQHLLHKDRLNGSCTSRLISLYCDEAIVW